jgi:putative transcriptional regulator
MFKNKIEYWAKVKGYKHKYLAEQCGVTEQTFVRWVKNRTQPDLEKAFTLSGIFQISLDQLVEGKKID